MRCVLPSPTPAVKEQRVVCFGRRIGDRLAGGVRVMIILTHDEGVEGVARIHAVRLGRDVGRLDREGA